MTYRKNNSSLLQKKIKENGCGELSEDVFGDVANFNEYSSKYSKICLICQIWLPRLIISSIGKVYIFAKEETIKAMVR